MANIGKPAMKARATRRRHLRRVVIPSRRGHWLERLSLWITERAGSSWAFGLAVLVVVVWAATGPIFGFGDTWQLVINTGTTIVTFLMVFLIQNTQNRDSEAVQVKLDELIRAMTGAHNALLDLEELEYDDLELIRGDYTKLAQRARDDLRRGIRDTDATDLSAR
jgi:low affinity Fe/Cu permease